MSDLNDVLIRELPDRLIGYVRDKELSVGMAADLRAAATEICTLRGLLKSVAKAWGQGNFYEDNSIWHEVVREVDIWGNQ